MHIRKIRSVLEDDPEQPRFVETVPKRGYRFVATVNSPAAPEPELAKRPSLVKTAPPRVARSKFVYVAALATLIGLAWYVRGYWVGRAHASQIRSLAVLPLRNLSNDPEQEYFSDVHDG